MPTLAELLNPQTAATQLYANPPAASGVSEQAVKNELVRDPQNLDTAIGAVAGGRNPAPNAPYKVDPNDRSGIWGGYWYDEAGNPRAGRDPNKPDSGGTSEGGSVRDSYFDRVNSAFSEFKPKTEDDIIKEETDRIQGQLDAINKVYDLRLSDARTANEGRLGQTRSLNVAGGVQFDPMGGANINETDRANQQVLDAINAERLAEISSIMAAARGETTRRVESQTDRFIGLANDQVNALSRAFGLSLDEENALRDAAVKRAQLTGNFEGDPTLSLREFLADEAYRRDTLSLSKEELDAKIEQARAAGREVVQGDDGTVFVYDSFTNTTTPLGKYPSRSERGGGGSGSGGGDGAQDSFYDLLISDLNSGSLNYQTIITLYGDATAKAVENRIRELQKLGRDPFAAPPAAGGAATTPAPTDRTYAPGVDRDLQDRLYDAGRESEIPGLAP